MDPSLARPLIIIEGKGGVGKTACAAALGLALARAGRRVLVCEVVTRGHVPAVFGLSSDALTPVELAPGLFSLNLLPEQCLEEYALIKLHFRAAYRLIFRNPVIRALVRLVPAMDELLIIGKIEHLVRTGGWDHVIIDAPVTGEGLLLFQLPRVITEAVASGPLHDDALRIREMLEDPSRCVMHLVSLAEEMPAEETEQLYHELCERVEIPLGRLLINRVFPTPLMAREQELYQALLADAADPILGEARDVVRFVEHRRRHQDRFVTRLANRVPLERLVLPEVFGADSERAVIESVAARFEM